MNSLGQVRFRSRADSKSGAPSAVSRNEHEEYSLASVHKHRYMADMALVFPMVDIFDPGIHDELRSVLPIAQAELAQVKLQLEELDASILEREEAGRGSPSLPVQLALQENDSLKNRIRKLAIA